MMKKIIKIVLPLSVAAMLFIGGYFYWRHEKYYPSTDNAYVQTNVINIAPQINGTVVRVYVHNHQHIKKGQPLFDIDPALFTIEFIEASARLDETKQKIQAANMAVQSAKAVIAEKKAELVHARLVTYRMLSLMKRQFVSRADGDLAIKNLDVAKAALIAAKNQLQELIEKRGQIDDKNAQLRLAEAAIKKSQLDLEYTHVIAPANGFIANFSLRRGDNVNAYQVLFALIEDKVWWVIANFKETQLANIRPGQLATIKIDMYPSQVFLGYVASISEDSGTSFSLLPPENASGNWVKVTQRFPVKIIITDRKPNYPFRLGASSAVTINTIAVS
ncbi:HlyD family secretion protein [Coxiella endosymbiont of Dermacentor marginatus]|uniref:HlyD family secretion protein n=1 Tax=Coxiella endosymbiont of Dermacentor marginatus TaxID=1656159 RepID=UPI002223A4FD|nr:HlyD family secretion protein [Coxiella endosymbiont of Dermacentor marginatus]